MCLLTVCLLQGANRCALPCMYFIKVTSLCKTKMRSSSTNSSTSRDFLVKQAQWILIGIVLAGLVTDARALHPNRGPSRYVHEQWTTETGFPGGVINGIAQTTDGYLWIGTDKGLLRFDGFDFKHVSLASVTTASNVPILQVLTDAGGKLWIRPQGGDLVRQKKD